MQSKLRIGNNGIVRAFKLREAYWLVKVNSFVGHRVFLIKRIDYGFI